MGVRFYERGVGLMCTEDHVLEHALPQFQIVGRLHCEIVWRKRSDLTDRQFCSAGARSEEERSLLAAVRVTPEQEFGTKRVVLPLSLEAESRSLIGLRHLV
jgi:hypothetical protein